MLTKKKKKNKTEYEMKFTEIGFLRTTPDITTSESKNHSLIWVLA